MLRVLREVMRGLHDGLFCDVVKDVDGCDFGRSLTAPNLLTHSVMSSCAVISGVTATACDVELSSNKTRFVSCMCGFEIRKIVTRYMDGTNDQNLRSATVTFFFLWGDKKHINIRCHGNVWFTL